MKALASHVRHNDITIINFIHAHLGIISDPSESLFFYDFPKRWSTYYDPSFTPVYEPVFTDASLEEKANEICGNDDFCKFDIAATGRTEIGEATLNGGRIFDVILNLSQPSNLLYQQDSY